MLSPEQRAEGQRLLAALTPGDWSFSDGAIHTENESGGAWVPSYTDNLSELNETALADGLAIEWLIRNRNALLADPPAVDVETIKRAAVREFAEAILEERVNCYSSGDIECSMEAVETWEIMHAAAARGANLDEKP